MQSHNNQKKQISIIDETVKTSDKIFKKKSRGNSPRLRKQLQNDEILKNYFVFDNEKNQLTTFRIEKEFQFGNKEMVTKQIIPIAETNSQPSNQQAEMNNLHVIEKTNQDLNISNIISNSYQTTLSTFENSRHQQLILQLFSLLLPNQQENKQ